MQPKPITARNLIRSILTNGPGGRQEIFSAYLKERLNAAGLTESSKIEFHSDAPSTRLKAIKRLLFHLVAPEYHGTVNVTDKNPALAGYGRNYTPYTPSKRPGLPFGFLRGLRPEDEPEDHLSDNFLKSAKQYLGKPYEVLDCYELIIRSMKDLGFRYHGEQGIKERLINMARANGLPLNTHLTGEGLVDAIGVKVCSKRTAPPKHPDSESAAILEEMTPFLRKGYLLSFSTPTRGHVGIVSHYGDRWTFLNSGRMDHDLTSTAGSKQVGEENLSSEIRNWFRLASSRNEPLQITLGRLDDQKLYAYIKPLTPLDEFA